MKSKADDCDATSSCRTRELRSGHEGSAVLIEPEKKISGASRDALALGLRHPRVRVLTHLGSPVILTRLCGVRTTGRRLVGVICFIAWITSSIGLADESDLEFFEKKIRPALTTYCYECHSTDSKKVGGELFLDSREGVFKGGETGPAVIKDKPDESLLIKAVRYTDDSLKMPPKGKLPNTVIADFETWVKRGAVDPRDQATASKVTASWGETMKQRSDWWSLRPVVSAMVPTVTDTLWSSNAVDRFIASRLEQSGLSPAAPTDPRTFARRLSLVLTGLPPTVDEVDQFVTACRSGNSSEPLPRSVVETLVDRTLQSPHFGEHWARHWMDVVRFSETHGNEWNYEVHHAWRYRDYLIRAFNADLPYDQFVREHIAGDLLPQPRWNVAEQFNESVIGTGFYRFGEVNHDDCIGLRSIGYDLADNQIDTLTKAFQATTVACARCHNHKLDAVSTEDYYAMLAIVRSSRNVSHCVDSPGVNAPQRQRLHDLKRELREELGAVWKQDAVQFARYMTAAVATKARWTNAGQLAQGLDPVRLDKWIATLTAEKTPFEDPLELWRKMASVEIPSATDAPADALAVSQTKPQIWQSLSAQFNSELPARDEFNRTRFVTFADFRTKEIGEWQAGGQSMNDGPSRDGDFIVHTEGDFAIQSILPAGRFTHSLSSKQNGTLRSRVLPAGKRYISFEILGQRSSAVRLVSNNCQLNYANYRALTSPDLKWVTFSPPEDRESLRTYAEMMTMFDNPKFPDQLAALGGDSANYKMPWDKAAENPRSYFGVTQVVLHDNPETPKPTLTHLKLVYQGIDAESKSGDDKAVATVPSLETIAQRTVMRATLAIDAWCKDQATHDDVVWLDALMRRELLGNKANQTPRSTAIVQEYRRVESELALPRVSIGVADGGPGIRQPVFLRGDCNRPAELVPRRYLEVLAMVEPRDSRPAEISREFTSVGSGRLELAEQIATARNPLTARVIVNRIWHYLFGTGLVRTVDDFGHVGEVPSHPELLDHLAGKFVADGWSMKRMIRSLVLTRTFQLANVPSDAARELDPQNRLLQHYPARRMEAESVRDAILFASGRLDRTLYGHSIQPYREKEYADRRLFPGPLDGNGRRSVYIKNNLMEAPKFLGAFNFPGGKVTQGRRDVTNVPAQALALLNDPFVLQQAEVWSNVVLANSSDSTATRLDKMVRSSLGRSPSAEELARFEQAIQQLAELYQVPSAGVMSSPAIWKDIAHALFNMNELIYIP